MKNFSALIFSISLISLLCLSLYSCNSKNNSDKSDKAHPVTKNKTSHSNAVSDDFCWNKSLTNYYKIKEYLSGNINTTSEFKISCPSVDSNKTDTTKVTEHFETHGNSFEYSVTSLKSVFKIKCDPDLFTIVQDSNGLITLIDKINYSRKTKYLFLLPSFKAVENIRNYIQYFDEKNIVDPKNIYKSPYRVYFTNKYDDIIMHKEYTIKSTSDDSYRYSKKNGLYEISLNGGFCVYTKISKK